MSDEIKHVQLGNFEDIVKMMVTSMHAPPLHHMKVKKKHLYFIPASLGFGQSVIYFVELTEEIGKKYVIYDTMQDTFSFSDEIITKPSLKHFVVVEVKTQNLFPKDLL